MLDYHRQLAVVTPKELNIPITVIGAGGIGSPTVLMLAKMGCENITVWDDDIVASHNVPNQLYSPQDIGKPKVVALYDWIKFMTGVEIKIKNERYTGQPLSGIVISAVDKMAVRKTIWEACKYKVRVQLFIDPRMGLELCRVYTINPCTPSEIDFYEGTLYNDEQSKSLPCTARAIIYGGFQPAIIVCRQVKEYAKGGRRPIEVIIDLKSLSFFKTL